MDSREAFIALNMVEGVGPVRARSLLEHFGGAPEILRASKNELLRVRNIGEDTAENISAWEKSVDLAGELKRIQDFGCHVLISAEGIMLHPLVTAAKTSEYSRTWRRRSKCPMDWSNQS